MKPIYIAAYSQSKFGKLFAKTVPEIIAAAVTETCAEVGAEPSAIGSVGVAGQRPVSIRFPARRNNASPSASNWNAARKSSTR